jgi:hypothetical protein
MNAFLALLAQLAPLYPAARDLVTDLVAIIRGHRTAADVIACRCDALALDTASRAIHLAGAQTIEHLAAAAATSSDAGRAMLARLDTLEIARQAGRSGPQAETYAAGVTEGVRIALAALLPEGTHEPPARRRARRRPQLPAAARRDRCPASRAASMSPFVARSVR